MRIPKRFWRLWHIGQRVEPNTSAELVEAAPTLAMREIYRRFWPYTKPFRRLLAFSLLLIAVAPMLDTVAIWLFKVLIDQVLIPHNFRLFFQLGAVYVGITVLMGAVNFGDQYLSTWVAERFLLDLRTEVFAHLHTLSVGFFERRRLGDVLARLTGDVAAIEALVLTGVADALSYAFKIVLFTGALVYLSWQLTVLAFVAIPLFWWLARQFSRRIKAASREKRRRSGSISVVAEESLGNAAVVQAYGRQDAEVARFHAENLGSFTAQMAATRLRALFTPLVELLELVGALLVIGVGTWQLARGMISLGGLLVFVGYLSQLYGPVRGFGRLSNTIFAAAASAERIVELLDQQPAVRDAPRPVRLARADGVVHFSGVTFRYDGTREPALRDLDFTVVPGATVALTGPSGAGKSTVGKLLLRFYDPDSGRITLDGHDLRELELRSLRGHIAVVMQETLVVAGTIRENILWGKPDADESEVVRAARAADAAEFIAELPDGYDTRIGERGRLLSGGQRQRIAIARAMIRDAPILLLDEPTTGLDAESTARILTPLRRLMAGRTTIVVSHNLLTVSDADQILFFDHGAVVERGTHAELLAAAGGYARMYRLHQRSQPTPFPASEPA